MAEIMISRIWPDGEQLVVSVEVDDSFPDVVAEARHATVKAYADALEITLATPLADDGDEDTV